MKKLNPNDLMTPDYIIEEIKRCAEVSGLIYDIGLIVDANNVMYRLAFAASGDITTARDMLAVFKERIIKTARENYVKVVVCAIDHGTTLRKLMLGAKPKPKKTEEQQAVIDIARAALHLLRSEGAALGFNPVWMDGYEADDIVAAFAASGMCINTIMYSTDSDLWQMTRLTGVDQLSPASGAFLRSEIEPHLVAGVKTLAGDSSDSIAGIKGIGPVTSVKILTGLQECELEDEQLTQVLNDHLRVLLPFPGSFKCLEKVPTPWPIQQELSDDVEDDDDLPF